MNVRLDREAFDWIVATIEFYVENPNPLEREVVASLREQMRPEFEWVPPERPAIDEAVIGSFVDVIERAMRNANWTLHHTREWLNAESTDSLVRARQRLADTLIGIGNTSRW